MENDVYCTYANRVNYEAKWSPVPPSTDITTLSGGFAGLSLLQHILLLSDITMTCSVKQSLHTSCSQQQQTLHLHDEHPPWRSTACTALLGCIRSGTLCPDRKHSACLQEQRQCTMGAMHAGVRRFFRHAPRQLGLPPDMRLPIYAQREFSKSVWDMRVAGVRGVVNLVLIFADQHSSLAGVVAQRCSVRTFQMPHLGDVFVPHIVQTCLRLP